MAWFGKGGKTKAKWAELSAQLEPFKRTAWIPRTERQTCGPQASKFSGVPALARNESWPLCGHCHEPMQLFLQLNSEELPQKAGKPFGEGLLQVFYCTNGEQGCEVECEAYFPFADSTLVRVLSFADAGDESQAASPVKEAFREKQITGWQEKVDYANGEELEALGCSLSEEQWDVMEEQGYPLAKDKLLGWPHWVQGVEYPGCPECGEPMALIFQIDSEDNLSYMFGDVGCSHVTQCPQHSDKLAIAWACC